MDRSGGESIPISMELNSRSDVPPKVMKCEVHNTLFLQNLNWIEPLVTFLLGKKCGSWRNKINTTLRK